MRSVEEKSKWLAGLETLAAFLARDHRVHGVCVHYRHKSALNDLRYIATMIDPLVKANILEKLQLDIAY